MTLPNGAESCTMSNIKYMQEATHNIEYFIQKNFNCCKLLKKDVNPFERDYQPELDITTELDVEKASLFHTQTGIL